MNKESDIWPLDGLKSVATCPTCGSGKREVLHRDLTDRIFFCAPGKWTMYQCMTCRSGYLDPVPTPSTIHLAYATYFTHEVTPRAQNTELSTLRSFLRMLANSHRNRHFGTTYEPINWASTALSLLLPASLRRCLDRSMRNLPKLPEGGRLLDVGFGGGEFLDLAHNGGWQVAGVDPDAIVVENARNRGLNVRQGGVEAFADQPESFDVITMSHVIEHLHDPKTDLKMAFKLLKPGGVLWIETPNIGGPGHKRFGRHWRGLDSPRHLVVFNREALTNCLNDVGFLDIKDLPYIPNLKDRFQSSMSVQAGVQHKTLVRRLSWDDKKYIMKYEIRAQKNADDRDNIMLMCWKPK